MRRRPEDRCFPEVLCLFVRPADTRADSFWWSEFESFQIIVRDVTS